MLCSTCSNFFNQLNTLLYKNYYACIVLFILFMSLFHFSSEHLFTCYLQVWDSDVKVAKPLLTYTCIKLDHQYGSYLNKVIDIKHKRVPTKLRLSSRGMHIETGRYVSNRIYRTCQLCNSVDIENEYHFVLILYRFDNYVYFTVL
jgi:hypothetical protein